MIDDLQLNFTGKLNSWQFAKLFFTETEKIVLDITLFTAVTVGLFLNSLISFSYLSERKLRESSIIFIHFLTINDIVIGLWVSVHYLIYKYVNYQIFDAPFCLVSYLIENFLQYQSQSFLLVILMYRYIRIKFPLNYEIYLTKRNSNIIIFIIFSISSFYCVIPVIFAHLITKRNSACNGNFSFETDCLILTILFLLPLVISAFIFHVKILKIAKKHVNLMKNQTKKYQNVLKSSKFNLIQILLIILLWISFSISIITLDNMKETIQLEKVTYAIPHIICFQTVTNPIFTILGNSEIKSTISKKMFMVKRKISPNPN